MGSEGKQQDRRRRRSKEPSGGGNGRPTHKTRPLDRLHTEREREGMIKASTHETRARSSSRTAKLAAKSGKGINRLAKVNKKKKKKKENKIRESPSRVWVGRRRNADR